MNNNDKACYNNANGGRIWCVIRVTGERLLAAAAWHSDEGAVLRIPTYNHGAPSAHPLSSSSRQTYGMIIYNMEESSILKNCTEYT